jgi:enolase-phosphatase E1
VSSVVTRLRHVHSSAPRTQRHATRAVLVDLDEVVIPRAFFRDVLLPAARTALPSFVQRRGAEPAVRAALDAIRLALPRPSVSDSALLVALDLWTSEDRTHPALRALHALVWEELFDKRRIATPVFADVGSAFFRWHGEGRAIFVSSSRPESAQRLLLERSTLGPLHRVVDRFFDSTGSRRDARWYAEIARVTGLGPTRIALLAESSRELAAASHAGLAVLQVLRGDSVSDGEFFWTRALDSAELDGALERVAS